MATTMQPATGETTKQLVNYRTDGGVAVIEMCDPPANTYTYEMNRQLDEAILKARMDNAVYVIVMTGEYKLESSLDAIRRGATDFLPKPIDRVRLKKTLDEVATIYDQRKRVRAFEEQLLKDLAFHGIVEKARSCWKYSISRGRWLGITRMCCWWDQPGRGNSWWPGRSTTSVR